MALKKRKDILDINDENSTTSQTSTEKGEVLRQAFNNLEYSKDAFNRRLFI
jgi:hypothetical protein